MCLTDQKKGRKGRGREGERATFYISLSVFTCDVLCVWCDGARLACGEGPIFELVPDCMHESGMVVPCMRCASMGGVGMWKGASQNPTTPNPTLQVLSSMGQGERASFVLIVRELGRQAA